MGAGGGRRGLGEVLWLSSTRAEQTCCVLCRGDVSIFSHERLVHHRPTAIWLPLPDQVQKARLDATPGKAPRVPIEVTWCELPHEGVEGGPPEIGGCCSGTCSSEAELRGEAEGCG